MASLTAAEIRKRFDDAEDPNTVEVPAAPSPGAKIRDLFPTVSEPAAPATPAAPSLADVLASPDALQADIPQSQAPAKVPFPTTNAEVRNLLAPAPNTEYGNVVPYARDLTTGETRMAMPSSLRSFLQGRADLLAGPGGMVMGPHGFMLTPEATASMMGGPGIMPRSPAAGTGKGIFYEQTAPLSPEFKAAPFAPNMLDQQTLAADIMNPPGSRPVAPTSPTGIPAPPAVEPPPPQATPATPQPVGAQWSGGNQIVGISPAEEAAYRSTAEGRKLIEPQPIGVPDRNAYVQGVNPNLVEQEQTVHTARELKALGIRSTEASQDAKQIAAEHNEARSTHLNNTTGGDTDVLLRTTQRQADIQAAKPVVFAPGNVKGPVDHAPIVAKIHELIDAPANRQNDAVQATLRPLLKRLEDDAGKGKITDPEEMWGMRQQIDRWTSPRMASEDSNLHYAAHQLSEVSGVIDRQIEQVAPGYDAMIARYAEHSREIEAMKVLQAEAKKTYVSGGGTMRMTFEGVQRMLRHITDMRNADMSDFNPYKNISDDRMAKLWALRDDLRRSASAVELAKTPGSDTGQNLWDMIKGLASGPEAQTALHAFAATHFGLPGYVASRTAGAVIGTLRSGKQAARDTTRAQELLRPRNALIDPNAPP